MIYQITNALLIPKILELAKTCLDTNPVTLEKILISGIGRKDARIFVEEKDGVVDGFLFASREEFEGEDAIFIQSCVIKPIANERNIGFELLIRVRRWGAELGLKNIYFMTTRNPKGFQKKYHFRYHATVLKRSV